MSLLNQHVNSEQQNTSWSNCHIDIWFIIAKYLRPEDTLTFSLICKKTSAVTNSEAFWSSIFNRYIRSKYPWLDKPTASPGSCIRDQTIRELFKNYPIYINRKTDPDSYDKAANKVCLQITPFFIKAFKIRTYLFRVQSRFQNYRRLAKSNRYEGCQILVVRTKHFVPVPYESDNLVIKSISKHLSQGFRAYKLKILFCDHFGNPAGESLVFDPVESVHLYNWWEPNFDALINNNVN